MAGTPGSLGKGPLLAASNSVLERRNWWEILGFTTAMLLEHGWSHDTSLNVQRCGQSSEQNYTVEEIRKLHLEQRFLQPIAFGILQHIPKFLWNHLI